MNEKADSIYSNPELQYTIKFSWGVGDDKPHWINYKVYKITGYNKEGMGTILFYGDRVQPDMETTEPICTGFIKWDGCMEIHDLNHHFCAWDNMLQNLMRDIYLQAAEIMGTEETGGRMDQDLANLKQLKETNDRI